MSSALDLVHEPRAGHANVDDDVNLAVLIRLPPERWHRLPYDLVADSEGFGVHQDAHGRDVDGMSRVWVLGSPRREVFREAFGDFPRGIDGIF